MTEVVEMRYRAVYFCKVYSNYEDDRREAQSAQYSTANLVGYISIKHYWDRRKIGQNLT